MRTTCPYCGVGCGLVVTRGAATAAATPARLDSRAHRGAGNGPDGSVEYTIAGDPEHPANFGRLCSKGAALGETLDVAGRLLHPEVAGRRASWAQALDAVAGRLTRAIAEHGPDSVAFYLSGQLLTEDYYVANKLMKGFIGSGNIDTNSRLCMASAVAGYKRAFGADFVPNSYRDLECAQLLVLVGSNMAWCHPVLFQRISRAKALNPEIRVVVIDPRRTATCELADRFLPIRAGTDVVLFNGLLSHLRREDALDWEFLDAHAEGFGAALRVAKESAPSIPAVAAVCGLSEADVAEFYRLFARAARTVTLFSQGVNQSSSGTDKVNSIINVHLATGRIGKPGAGPFSLTGQPNAMGGREVGGLANQLAAHMDFTPEHAARVQRFWHAPAIARRPGLAAVDLFDAIHAGRVKAVWIMATNPVVSMPGADRVAQALQRCDLVVVSDCVRTDTTAYADILLPATTWGEKSGTVTNSERRISRQRAFLEPPGQSKPDWWIVTEVAKRMTFADAFPYRSPAEIFREHARLSGFENDGTRAFDIGRLADIDDAAYDSLQPVRWPLPEGRSVAVSSVLADGRFFTATGRARLVATEPRLPQHVASERLPFVLNTGRVRDQWHTMTRTGKSSRLAARDVEPFVQIHPADAVRCGLRSGALARLSGDTGCFVARVVITSDVRPGHVFAPMHWSAQYASCGRVGVLIAAATDPVSGQPELKHAPVRLEPYEPSWYGFALSRTPLTTTTDCTYVARAKGRAHWRYELAGETTPASWRDWARSALGHAGHWIELSDPAAGRYRAAHVVEDRLRACLFVARVPALPAREWLAGLFERPLDEAAKASLLAARAADGAVESGPLVCACFSVGRDTLLDAIRTQSLVTTDQIGRTLGAGTNCGSCLPELAALLADTGALHRAAGCASGG